MPRWLCCSSEYYEGRSLLCRNGSVGSNEVVAFYVEVGYVKRLAGVAETESLSGKKGAIRKVAPYLFIVHLRGSLIRTKMAT